MADSDAIPPAQGDEAELFLAYNQELMRTIRGSIRPTTPETIEDACAFAWMQFLRRQPDRENNWQGWLYKVARREALQIESKRLDAVRRPLVSVDELEVETNRVSPVDEVEIRHDVSEAFTIIRELPARLQRVALLQALGHTFDQIGEITGDSPTRVEHLMARASDRVHAALAERAHAHAPFAPRAERLWQLEHDPPKWLVKKIGRPVGPSRKIAGRMTRRRAWRRAAIALDDYRELAGADNLDAITAEKPTNPTLRAAHAAAWKALEEHDAARCGERSAGHER